MLVQLSLKGPAVAPLAGNVTLRPTGQAAGAPLVMPIVGDKLLSRVAPLSTWEVSVSIPGYWSRREDVTAGAAGTTVVQQIATWPMGAIRGTVSMRPLPKEIAIETLRPRRPVPKEDALRGAMRCPIDQDGGWRCELPAATFDLRLSVPGFAPEYRLTVSVPAGNSLDLGAFVPRPGASIAGWAESRDGILNTEECLVHLIPLGASVDPQAAAATRLARDGFFQFAGVPPGSYRLEIDGPAGLVPATSSLIVVPSTAWDTLLDHPLILRHQRGGVALPP